MDIHQVVLDDETQQEVKEEFYQNQEDLRLPFVSVDTRDLFKGQ